jgi:hypothetical protein
MSLYSTRVAFSSEVWITYFTNTLTASGKLVTGLICFRQQLYDRVILLTFGKNIVNSTERLFAWLKICCRRLYHRPSLNQWRQSGLKTGGSWVPVPPLPITIISYSFCVKDLKPHPPLPQPPFTTPTSKSGGSRPPTPRIDAYALNAFS